MRNTLPDIGGGSAAGHLLNKERDVKFRVTQTESALRIVVRIHARTLVDATKYQNALVIDLARCGHFCYHPTRMSGSCCLCEPGHGFRVCGLCAP